MVRPRTPLVGEHDQLTPHIWGGKEIFKEFTQSLSTLDFKPDFQPLSESTLARWGEYLEIRSWIGSSNTQTFEPSTLARRLPARVNAGCSKLGVHLSPSARAPLRRVLAHRLDGFRSR